MLYYDFKDPNYVKGEGTIYRILGNKPLYFFIAHFPSN